MWQFIEVFKKVAASARIQDDDFADRLSHRYTVALLILFTILVGSSQFVGSPIACWCPAQFTGAMVQYTNYVCWIANTYFVPTNDVLPTPDQPRIFRINYYQWVPFILALMAFLFYTPYAVWHLLAKPSGLDAKSVMKIMGNMDQANQDSRDKCMRNTSKLFDRALDYHHGGHYYDHSWFGLMRRRIGRCCLPAMRGGSYITTLYIFTKLLYCANVCGQFFLLNLFMGANFDIYGIQVIQQLMAGKDFWESTRFPRVTMCDFVIRTLGENNQRNTIQCTLPINLFNEKIFIFIWFWMCLVAVFSVYSLFVWIITFTMPSRVEFIKRYLKINDRYGSSLGGYHSSSTAIDAKIFDSFVFDYLKQDGVFLLRIIKKNTSDLVVGELVCHLWDQYKRSARFAIQGAAGGGNDDTMHHHHRTMEKNPTDNPLLPNGYHPA